MSKSIIGVVDTSRQAELIVSQLQRAGFARPDLSILRPREAGSRDLGFEHHASGIAGALIGFGVSDIEAERCQDKLVAGDILVAVHVHSREAQRDAESVMKRIGAHDIVSAPNKKTPREA